MSPLFKFLKNGLVLFATILITFFAAHTSKVGIFGVRIAEAQSWRKAFSKGFVDQRIREAIAVQNRHSEQLIKIPGVVGIGTGIGANGLPIIRVFSRFTRIEGIPKVLDGIPVSIKFTGNFIAYQDPTDRFERPVPIGVSTGHPDITAGTIGVRVKDELGNLYALSNNHVYANQNEASIGDNILQPGAFDGGIDPFDTIGVLRDFEVIDFSISGSNLMDAAIADTTISELGQATLPDGYGMPNSQIFGDGDGDGFFDNIADLLQLPVQKYGRTTGLTHGQISEINVTSIVCYANCSHPVRSKLAWFVDQIAITANNNEAFSAGGDSGSLILTDRPDKRPVALLFAGGDNTTLANRLDLVIDQFDIAIDGANDICYGDLSMDRDVDGYDLFSFLTMYPLDSSADINYDGVVNTDDFLEVIKNFGRDNCP